MDRLFDKIIIAILCSAFLGMWSWLDSGQSFSAYAGQSEQDTSGQNASGNEEGLLTEMERKMQTVVTVDFREAPIEDVIKSLTEQADIDIVKSPKVTGNISATLTNVPLYDALENILAVHGFAFVTTEKVVRIISKDELALQPVKISTMIYHFDYANVDDAVTALKDMLTPRGKIATNAATKHILITDTENNMELIDQFITEMDQEIPQILIEAQIYDVSSEASLDLGVNWYAGRLTEYNTAGQAIASGGTGATTGGITGESHTEPFTNGVFNSTITRAGRTSAFLNFGILNDHIDLAATLEASQEDINAKLLANPKILVLNGEMANLKVIKEIPYQELTQTAGGGNIGTTSFKEVGIELQVTPYLTRENKIRMEIRPTFSAQSGSVPMPIISGTSTITSLQPIVDTREASTHALVTSGQTVVIGGLKKKDIVQEVSKVPILSDVPVLGLLFRYKGETTVNSELLVFITPRLISEPVLSEKEMMQLETSKIDMCDPQEPIVSVDTCK